MLESEFWACELREVWNRINGFYTMEEARQRNEAELVRLQTASIVQLVAKKGRKIKPADVWRFPWDNEAGSASEIRIMTPEERIDTRADRFMRRILEKKQSNGKE